MHQKQIDELVRLAGLSAELIGDNENNVKYKFIIPFLESFGYAKGLDFEHAAQGNRLDILIKTASNHRIVVEAKSYGRNLDEYVPQLRRYCDEWRPLLAIIANGEDIRFYSPFWRKPNFADTLIYSIARRQLVDRPIVKRIELVLGKQFLEDGSIVKHIDEREREIEQVNRQLQIYEQDSSLKIETLTKGIEDLERQIGEIQSGIAAQRLEIESVEGERSAHVRALELEHLVRLSQDRQVVAAILSPVGTMGAVRRPRGRKGYEQLSDYLLPVLQLMLRSGIRHTEAFRRIAEKLDVEYSTAAAQCTTRLRLTTEQFVGLVESKKIKALLKERFPLRAGEIDREL